MTHEIQSYGGSIERDRNCHKSLDHPKWGIVLANRAPDLEKGSVWIELAVDFRAISKNLPKIIQNVVTIFELTNSNNFGVF